MARYISIWGGMSLRTWQLLKLFNNHYENSINTCNDYGNNGGPYFYRARDVRYSTKRLLCDFSLWSQEHNGQALSTVNPVPQAQGIKTLPKVTMIPRRKERFTVPFS
jgi:hypothetical protein